MLGTGPRRLTTMQTARNEAQSASPSRRPVIILFGAALLLRLLLAPRTVAYVPDEVWQYLEPAYGLVTGRWIITWEFREGARSWFLPDVLALPMALGHWLAPGSQWHLILPRVLFACLSLGIPAAFWQLGKRISTTHALVALFVGAFWVEIFYFAPRTLGDSFGCTLAFPAIWAAYRFRESRAPFWGFLAGFLISLSFVVRFQLAPALLILSLWALWRRPEAAWLSLLSGSALGLGVDALANLAAGTPPFFWILRNLTSNLVEGRANSFGTQPPFWYVTTIALTWKAAAIFMVPAIVVGCRRFPVVAGMALVVILTHSLIPHKELRFILFAQMAFIFLAAVGSVDLAGFLAARLNEPLSRMIAALLALWLIMSASVGLADPFREYWTARRDFLEAQTIAGRQPDICGFAAASPGHPAPSHAFLNRDVPILKLESPTDAARIAPSVNTIVAPRAFGRQFLPGFALTKCVHDQGPPSQNEYCVFKRPGNCSGNLDVLDYNRALEAKKL